MAKAFIIIQRVNLLKQLDIQRSDSIHLSHSKSLPHGICSSQILTLSPTCCWDWLAAHQTHFLIPLCTQPISQPCFANQVVWHAWVWTNGCGWKWCIPLPGVPLKLPAHPPHHPHLGVLLATRGQPEQLWMSSVKMKDGSLSCWAFHPTTPSHTSVRSSHKCEINSYCVKSF